MIGLDSSALIDLFRGESEIIELLKTLNEELITTYLNYFEILGGLNLEDKSYQEERGYFENLFQEVTLFNLSKKSCESSSLITWDLKKKGKITGQVDCMIAGILLSNGVNKIITRNVKHFENIKGLKVIAY
jgi:predicted nucleic acid-binding protein